MQRDRLCTAPVSYTHLDVYKRQPLHNSQRLIKTNEDGSIIIHLFLVENYELERLVLGFGNGIEIIKPEGMRKRMKSILEKSLEKYKLGE